MKRLMMFLLTLAMVCTMGVISFAEGNIAPHDLYPEPIIPDTCKHNYDLDKVVREEFRNMPIGRDFIKVTYYYVCTKCGDTKTEVETYDA